MLAILLLSHLLKCRKMQEKEIWKDVPGYEGRYQVSSLGRVRSLDRLIRGNKCEYIRKGDFLIFSNVRGYLSVALHMDRKRKHFKVHQLVAMAFLDHTPNGHERVVDHIDFNKLNNKVENLRIVTQRENANQKHIKNTSKHTGVHWDKRLQNWRASIGIGYDVVNLGGFDDENKAAIAYKEALELVNKGKSVKPVVDKYRHKFSSKYIGVSRAKRDGRWEASIRINGKNTYLGKFDDELKASEVYQEALALVKSNKSVQSLVDKHKPKYSSKYKGVIWHKRIKKWTAVIHFNKSSKHLGYFLNEYDAHLAYEKAAKELCHTQSSSAICNTI